LTTTDIRYGIHASPFGSLLLAVSEQGVCDLSFNETPDVQALAARWPRAQITADPAITAPIAAQLFTTPLTSPPALHLHGSPFQLIVWQALRQIPLGAVCSYSDLAASINRPSAARAVGQAVAANCIAWLIPCHRVIRKNGAIDGYRWGNARKQAMLAWEAEHAFPDSC
jgi:AraC family transcriptional regulator of adaptative response/methylated-DNA-[protein]-cysteine methyltransferase